MGFGVGWCSEGVEGDSEAKQDFLTQTAEKQEISKLDFNFFSFFFFNFSRGRKKKEIT